MLDKQARNYKEFAGAYYSIYQTQPIDNVSYVTFEAVMSVIDALKQYSDLNINQSMHEKILYSYLLALKKNPGWYRLNNIGIYRLTPAGELLIKRLSIVNP